ncbi:la-related protein 6B [Tanacetum coccineum]
MAAQEQPPSSSPDATSSSQTLETLTPSLTRSLSKLNAKAPEFVPRTAPAAVVSPPPPPPPQNTPGIIHVFPKPNSSFRHAHLPFGMPYHNPNKNDTPRMRLWLGGGGGGGGRGVETEPRFNGGIRVQSYQQADTGLWISIFDWLLISRKLVFQYTMTLYDAVGQIVVLSIPVIIVEYYFSDINLATTDHLMRFISKDPEGYVPISVVVSFKKIKALVSGHAQLATILRNSGKLVVSEDGKKVKRQHPLTEADMEELQSRIIVAENLPEDHCHQNLMKIFSAVGSVKTIRTCQPQASNGGASSASRGASKADAMHFSNKLHAFVEYETIELAEKAALELNKEGNWRNSLKVRLLRRPSQAKPAQARGKKEKAGQEDEAVHKEDDTSTSEQHSPNEKHLDDTHQQSEVQSHEHVGEDHSNEKEGGQKKGRNRGRGKGRGRPQYNNHNNHHNNHYNNHNNHNNRGAHMVTPPSSNSINNEHPVIGKQPPGPRMPDGTRGFSMGRGKPISVAIET